VQCIKFVCYVCFALRRYGFVVKVIKNGRRVSKIVGPESTMSQVPGKRDQILGRNTPLISKLV